MLVFERRNCRSESRTREKEMGFLSHRVKRSELEAGDHIYTWRSAFIYSHHGIYIGDGKVIHFTHEQNLSSPLHSSSCSDFPDCSYSERGTGVITSCLDCFLRGGSMCRYQYGVSKKAFLATFRSGTCTTAKSLSPEDVIHRAKYFLRNGFGEYDVFTNNCEDFALHCKTGLIVRGGEAPGGSGQATSAVLVPVAAVVSLPLLVFVSSPVVIGAAAVAVHAFGKYATDVGVRHDVVKVHVEHRD